MTAGMFTTAGDLTQPSQSRATLLKRPESSTSHGGDHGRELPHRFRRMERGTSAEVTEAVEAQLTFDLTN